MLQHNGRLMNPLDPYTQKLKQLTGKRKKTDEDLIEIMMVEARGGCWETEDGFLALPNDAVWASIFAGAKSFKRGSDIKKALFFDDISLPIEVEGSQIKCDDFLKDPENIFYRSVKIGRNRVMRARPKITRWKSAVHTFELFEDVIEVRDLVPILNTAGRLVGIGDYRPTYGTFTAEIL